MNLVWLQVMSTDANAGLSEAFQNMTGVNVISPTWFYVTDNNGNIINNATADYVSLAHEKGLKVWGLVDNFTQDISTYEVLSRTSSRQNLVSQLVNAAVELELMELMWISSSLVRTWAFISWSSSGSFL